MSEQEELATGGFIEPGGIPYVSDDPGPEIVFLPRNAQVYPNPGGPLRNTGTSRYIHIVDGEMELTPHGVELARELAADFAARSNQKPYQPSFTFPTEQSLRQFVKKCVDERLDELAREFNEHPGVQPGTWRKGVE